MSVCNILDNLLKQFGSIFGESQRLIYAQALGSMVPGRNILCKTGSVVLDRKHWRWAWIWHGIEGINLHVTMRNQVKFLAEPCTILCKLANNSPLAHHTRDKLGCCIISYRTLIRLFYRQFIGSLSAKLRLSLNRDTPTLLTNLHLTNLCRLFILFCYPLCDEGGV